MFSSNMYSLFSVIVYIFSFKSCVSEMLLPPQPSLYLYSPGELEYTDVLVKRVGDNLTLSCELNGDVASVYVWNYVPHDANVTESPGELEDTDVLVKRVGDNLTLSCELNGDVASVYVWNYVPHDANVTERPYIIERNGSTSSRLLKNNLQVSDSGRYVCSAPPFSQAKYILVQPISGHSCSKGAFSCGNHCVLAAYVCDGRRDCLNGDDEAPALCGPAPCARADRLNCSTGRCVAEAACCRTPHALCKQPHCCGEHPRYALRGAFVDVDMPPVFDDRHAPDDYGFIQSTIYTVTACALIFMIAVVLLVSAICKMHMKRAALRDYSAGRRARDHCALHLAQLDHDRHRYPPCYEASGLLEHATHSPLPSPTHDTQCGVSVGSASPSASERRTRLAALTSVFTSRYRQVPLQCPSEVEMRSVSGPIPGSPSRAADYTSPAGAPPGDGAPQLNQTDPPPPARLTLQLGRFQLSIPRFGRAEARPDTPNVAELDIEHLDFVRLNSHDTYTLNGRTIRLLGGNFENYPTLPGDARPLPQPPPYNEAVRYKRLGPPPEYLSRDTLHRTGTGTGDSHSVDEEARSNIEMPPCYDELSATVSNGNNSADNGNTRSDNDDRNPIVMNRNLIIMSNIIESVCSDTGIVSNELRNSLNNIGEASGSQINDSAANTSNDLISGLNDNSNNNGSTLNSTQSNENIIILKETSINNNNNSLTIDSTSNGNNGNGESINSVIDNLPAIDSDVNANDSVVASVSC